MLKSIRPINFCANPEKMVRLFSQQPTGKICLGNLMTESAAKRWVMEGLNFPNVYIGGKNMVPGFSVPSKLKKIFLDQDATIEDAKKVFDTMA